MGHRTLVAVEGDPGRFDCYRSQWGLLTLWDSDPGSVVADVRESQSPLATGVSTREALSVLDPRSDEALVVRTREEVTAYLVRRLDVPTAEDDAANADGSWTDGVPVVLVPVTDPESVTCLDTVLQTAKGILGDAVDAGLFSNGAAERYLGVLVARHPDVPPRAVWLTPPEVTATV